MAWTKIETGVSHGTSQGTIIAIRNLTRLCQSSKATLHIALRR